MAHKILIIDEDTISQNMLRSTLTKAGYSVIVASNGDEGINKPSEDMPGLIILDHGILVRIQASQPALFFFSFPA